MAISKFDKQKFVEYLESYLPSIVFEDDIFEYTESAIGEVPIPGCIRSSCDPTSLKLFCNIFKLNTLNSVFGNEDFEDLIFDTDLRRKIDSMMISSVFRPIDVVREFSQINSLIVETYMDCIANFKGINKHSYVGKYIADPLEQKLFTKILTTGSRQHLKVMLGLKSDTMNPMDVLKKSLDIANLKTDIALMGDNDAELEKWIKLRVVVAGRLHQMGAGTQSDLDRLINALKAEADYEDPKIYTKEDLENLD
jgi:hypothetical protein